MMESELLQTTLRDHDTKFQNLLERCRQKRITLNKHKLKFKLHELSYVGHVIFAEGLKPDPAKVKAIVGMPSSADKQGVRSILGMVNYLQKFAPGLSELTKPIRDLLKEDVEFVWEESVHEECFKRVKLMYPFLSSLTLVRKLCYNVMLLSTVWVHVLCRMGNLWRMLLGR